MPVAFGNTNDMRRVTAASLCVLGGFALGLVLPRFKSREVSSTPVSIADRVAGQAVPEPTSAPAIVDPGKRALQLLKAPASLTRDVEFAEALSGMTKEDFATFTKEIQDLLKKQPREGELAEAILDHWFQVDPLSARDAAKKAVMESKNRDHESLAGRFAAAAARHDPQWALENLLAQPTSIAPGWSSNAVLMEEVTKKDRKLADAWMQKFQDNGWRQSLLAGYVNGLAESNPLAALDVAIAEKTFERVNLIPSAVEAAARAGSNMASLALSKIDDASLRRTAAWEAAGIIAEESVADPFGFLREEAGLDHPPGKDDSSWHRARNILGTLVDRNAAEAANWAMSLPKESQQIVLGLILDSWSRSDPDAMLTWAREQQSNAETGGAAPVSRFATDLGKLLSAQNLLGQGQIHEALQVAPSQMSENDAQGLQQFVWEAAVNDPEATAIWAARLPASGARDSMVSTAAQQYATARPEQAAAWLEQLPNGSMRDSAILGVVKGFTREDPSAASEWVVRISDPTKLEEGVKQVWWSWARNDEAAAREWLTSVPRVSERTKRKLLGP